jgi:hypothetical protein
MTVPIGRDQAAMFKSLRLALSAAIAGAVLGDVTHYADLLVDILPALPHQQFGD